VAALAVALLLLGGACTDDQPPSGSQAVATFEANSFAPPESASPEDVAQARVLARTFADGLQQDAPTRITPRQLDCLVDQLIAHLNIDVLSGIASSPPDPHTVSDQVRTSFVNAFDRCLPPDVASALRNTFDG
jgi:hypothetical protein